MPCWETHGAVCQKRSPYQLPLVTIWYVFVEDGASISFGLAGFLDVPALAGMEW